MMEGIVMRAAFLFAPTIGYDGCSRRSKSYIRKTN
jgi:hypothetical protein